MTSDTHRRQLLTSIWLVGDTCADQYGEEGEEEHQQHGREHAPRIGGLRPRYVRAEAGRALPEVLLCKIYALYSK